MMDDLFQGNLTKREKLVRVRFFNIYKISNQKIKNIKQIFINFIHIFQQHQLIEEHFLFLTNRSRINIHDLTISNISDNIILRSRAKYSS